MDPEEQAKQMFEATRNAMGYGSPSWEELHDQTRQFYREEVARRAVPQEGGT